MEILDVVNEDDKVVGTAPKDEVYEKQLIHRIVHVLLFNDEGEMALSFRSKYKKGYPSCWDVSASGHVRSGETSEEAAKRELKEELGIEKLEIHFMAKFVFDATVFWNGKPIKKVITVFRARHSGPFKINKHEVEKTEFFNLDRIYDTIARGEKFHPELLFVLRNYFNMQC